MLGAQITRYQTSMDADFAEYFTLAQTNTLAERESLIIELRYGFTDDEAHTLEEIGQRIALICNTLAF